MAYMLLEGITGALAEGHQCRLDPLRRHGFLRALQDQCHGLEQVANRDHPFEAPCAGIQLLSLITQGRKRLAGKATCDDARVSTKGRSALCT